METIGKELTIVLFLEKRLEEKIRVSLKEDDKKSIVIRQEHNTMFHIQFSTAEYVYIDNSTDYWFELAKAIRKISGMIYIQIILDFEPDETILQNIPFYCSIYTPTKIFYRPSRKWEEKYASIPIKCLKLHLKKNLKISELAIRHIMSLFHS